MEDERGEAVVRLVQDRCDQGHQPDRPGEQARAPVGVGGERVEGEKGRQRVQRMDVDGERNRRCDDEGEGEDREPAPQEQRERLREGKRERDRGIVRALRPGSREQEQESDEGAVDQPRVSPEALPEHALRVLR